jgi:hypothetical protein
MGASYTVMLLHCNVWACNLQAHTLQAHTEDRLAHNAWQMPGTRPCLGFSSSFSHWVQMTAFEMYADLCKTATSASF